MSLTITLTFRWPMGHRILGLVGAGAKCSNVHGHNWEAEVELPNDDDALEFGAVKSALDTWVNTNLDHGFLVGADDPFLDWLLANESKHVVVAGQPTTECVAALLAEVARLYTNRVPTRVHVREGHRNAATWTP